jgi:hypothetical protein
LCFFIPIVSPDISIIEIAKKKFMIYRSPTLSDIPQLIQFRTKNISRSKIIRFKERVMTKIWKIMYNPNFKPIEFDGFRKQAGLISLGLYQTDRLIQLNKIAISQMKSLINNRQIKKLK